ncbi:MAG: alpha/beta hydrolase [Spirochaetales bacterium]|mgnify:FL=1|jgi:alpha-beta hydrolase superfamily lysophospholipase|nr:alpha/beta hydrolase [Spirochaetales bacterium]
MPQLKTMVSSDQTPISYHEWLPKEGSVKALLLILHGMAEHSKRYDEFAKFLTKQGFAVWAPDHRGHGKTAEGKTLGYFAKEDGWQRVADDAFELSEIINGEYPDQPLFLLGHSMGSFLARTLLVQHADVYDGVIIVGTGASKGLLGKVGKLIAKYNAIKYGPEHPDALLDKMSFGSYNKRIKDPASKFAWLSRDPDQVKRYEDDPLCGFVCTSSFFKDLLTGLEVANDRKLAKQLPGDVPLYIISGSEDPVGDYSKGVRAVCKLYKNAGVEDVTLTLVEGGRHEVLNEIDRAETYKHIVQWMKKRI